MGKRLFIIGLLLISILAMGVSAADVTLNTALLSVQNRPTETFSVSFIVNNASQNFSSISLSQSGLSDFGLNFSISGVAVSSFPLTTSGSDSSKTITVNGKVPKNINTRSSPYTGTITLSGTDLSKSLSMSIDAEGQLELDNVKFVVDGSSKSIDDGDTRKDVKPGAKLEISGDVLNQFTNDQDITIEDVSIEITIENIDDGEDMSDDYDIGDIDADDKEDFKITFDLPEDVDEDDYNVNMLVEGTDENGAKHAVEWKNVQLKIEKDKHDIWIVKASLSPSSMSCTRNLNIDVELKNQGTSNEEEVVLKIENSDLGINTEDTSIPEIEEGTGDDTEYSKTYSFKIDADVNAGTYPITLRVYYDTDTLSYTKIVDLAVVKCAVTQPETTTPTTPTTPVVVVTPPTTPSVDTTPEIITSPVTETTETSFLQSNMYLIFLIAAIGVAVIVIIVMMVVLFSLKRRNE
ncbi:MAG: hypothetical protein KKC54_08930 [Nanoarchaeota archaeon]|nr:hypothetical protein [Nanoarchaeota archaeon]